MKDYLENEGYEEVTNAKKTIRHAFQDGLLTPHSFPHPPQNIHCPFIKL
jgi:hypothetical protein